MVGVDPSPITYFRHSNYLSLPDLVGFRTLLVQGLGPFRNPEGPASEVCDETRLDKTLGGTRPINQRSGPDKN